MIKEWLEAQGFELCLGMVFDVLKKEQESHPESAKLIEDLAEKIKKEAKLYLPSLP